MFGAATPSNPLEVRHRGFDRFGDLVTTSRCGHDSTSRTAAVLWRGAIIGCASGRATPRPGGAAGRRIRRGPSAIEPAGHRGPGPRGRAATQGARPTELLHLVRQGQVTWVLTLAAPCSSWPKRLPMVANHYMVQPSSVRPRTPRNPRSASGGLRWSTPKDPSHSGPADPVLGVSQRAVPVPSPFQIRHIDFRAPSATGRASARPGCGAHRKIESRLRRTPEE